MGNLSQAVELDLLASANPQALPRSIRSADQVAEAIFAEAASQGRPFQHLDPPSWRRRWISSKRFFLMRIPLSAAALTCKPRDREWAITRIHAQAGEDSMDRPITVEINKLGVGRTEAGFTPPIVVLDGKHRFMGATLRGSSHIWAWVGEIAAERLSARKSAVRDPKMFRGPLRSAATNLESQAMLHAEDGEHKESLDTILARDLGSDPTVMRRMVAQFHQTHGRYHVGGAIRAVAPPGWSGTVEKMKNHPEIGKDKAFKLAWWMHDQGYRPSAKKD